MSVAYRALFSAYTEHAWLCWPLLTAALFLHFCGPPTLAALIRLFTSSSHAEAARAAAERARLAARQRQAALHREVTAAAAAAELEEQAARRTALPMAPLAAAAVRRT
jgi:hypothetical protein